MLKKKIGRLFYLLLLAGLLLVTQVLQGERETNRQKCKLIDVIDGDTISVLYNGEQASVRLIGVDTPESVHEDAERNSIYGKLASEFTEDLLANLSYVYIEFDVSMYDTYDRLLAYVYLNENDEFEGSINYLLVSEGYAINKEYQPNIKYASVLKKACDAAKKENKGLWNLEGIELFWNE